MIAQHTPTPGPWTCKYTGTDKDGIKRVIAGDASFPDHGNQPLVTVAECKERDAALIAAAPDLLAALEGIMQGVGDGCECIENKGHCFYCMARDAIAKAQFPA